jgi:hypothetical protein
MAGKLTFEIDKNPQTQSLAHRDAAMVTGKVDVGAMARRAEATSGIPIKKLAKAMRSFTGGQGKERGGVGQVNGAEFLRWRLYEVPKKERERFISDARQWEIEAVCNDQAAAAQTVEKSKCTAVLEEAGLVTIPIAAMLDTAGGEHGPSRTIGSALELIDFLAAGNCPLFAKPNQLLGSFGAFRIEESDGSRVRISGDGWVEADDLMDRLIGREVYVLQSVIENHDALAAFSPRLGTIRTINLVGSEGIDTPFCMYKIPAAGNIADNFWRPGNLIADVDPLTGTVRRAVTGIGGDQIEVSQHPDTGAEIVGMTLPFWDELLELNAACCRTFSGVRFQSLDVAITNTGPVIVEVNSGSSFDLPQVATGRGFLTDEVRGFFEGCGVDFHADT